MIAMQDRQQTHRAKNMDTHWLSVTPVNTRGMQIKKAKPALENFGGVLVPLQAPALLAC